VGYYEQSRKTVKNTIQELCVEAFLSDLPLLSYQDAQNNRGKILNITLKTKRTLNKYGNPLKKTSQTKEPALALVLI